MQSSTRSGLVLCLLVVALTGCIASTGSEAELHVSDGSGDIVVHVLLEGGELSSADAWWSEDAPELDVSLSDQADRYEALVFKNDIRVNGPQSLVGSTSQAVFTWDSGTSQTIAEPGDRFEVIIVDVTDDRVVASYALTIVA